MDDNGIKKTLKKWDIIYGQSPREQAVGQYRISSYKALPPIISAFLIMPAPGTLLCEI